jgi:HK97 family phage prohead protease
MKLKNQKEIRRVCDFELRALEGADDFNKMYVEGYAAKFDKETVLFEYDGIEYKEKIDRNAFIEADLRDVIFNYNHTGKVMARTRNKTLEVRTDDTGLYFRAKLGGTEEGRRLYEEIKGGYIDRMSFQFSIREDSDDNNTNTRTIMKVKRLYDVSAVDIPAYDDTSVSARDYFTSQKELEDKVKEENKRKELILKTLL